ncbi:trypsin-like serine protease [Streptomyces aurantiacus]|uniref:Peptidase S1 domain-containing protein n=1 Tax=Streptomyces aurantiacus JA 4570 TaxID=1286094 RepID=S4AIT3_9ACTN|nr:trypsin-like serine protease [Streptomyces aurantiacus]EPH41367.1 hypothetical protein STRAU_5603 [Streptomyces aurantiacus JA 4570]
MWSATIRIAHRAMELPFRGGKYADIFETAPDREENRVKITTRTVSDELVSSLADAFGADSISVVHAPEAPQDALFRGSRIDDRSPFWGGAQIITPKGGDCSSGLPWVAGDVSMMLTAAHCVPNGGSVTTRHDVMGYVVEGMRENWDGNGARRGTERFPNDDEYRGDLALVEMPDGEDATVPKFSEGMVYGVGNTEGRRIRGVFSRPAQRGDEFCTGGFKTTEVCGWTTGYTRVNRFINDNVFGTIAMVRGVNTATKRGQCSKRGDSGGPAYIVNSDGSINAKGIISGGSGGGSDQWAGRFELCTLLWTDVYQALESPLPGTLRTAATG